MQAQYVIILKNHPKRYDVAQTGLQQHAELASRAKFKKRLVRHASVHSAGAWEDVGKRFPPHRNVEASAVAVGHVRIHLSRLPLHLRYKCDRCVKTHYIKITDALTYQ